MDILNTTALRGWAKVRKFPDAWWFTVDGGEVVGPVPLAEIPKQGHVLVLNDTARGTADEQWFVYRYPGYISEEERLERERVKRLASPKQIVALEFFGYKQAAEMDKIQVSDLLDHFFETPYNRARYWVYVFENLDRIYKGRELAEQGISMLRFDIHFLKENISKERLSKLVDELTSLGVSSKEYVNFIRQKYPDMLLADSTRSQKVKSYEKYHREDAQERANRQKRVGCLGMFAFFLGILCFTVSSLIYCFNDHL